MNLRKRFLEIRDFLKPYQRIWENEIMLMYPAPLEGYPPEWISDLGRFQKQEDVIQIEKKNVFPYITQVELIKYYERIEELCQLPQNSSKAPFQEDRFTWLYIIPKKQHEIKNLAPHIKNVFDKNQMQEVLDIGGGIGLLAQTLNNYLGLKVTTLDMDPVLQKTGKDRHDFNAKNPANKVSYKNIKIDENTSFTELLTPATFPVGLHTCGKLALDLIRISSQKKVHALLSFGCCYHIMKNSPEHQNISCFAQENDPLWMNQFALTLACRAHRKMDDKNYVLKLKVKHFRYAMHILLHDHYDLKELVSLGNSNPKLYDQSFADYALEQFKRIKIIPKHSEEELNQFFSNPELQELIDKMLTAGIIRNAMGRLLEIYLLLDRAIYLEEQGYQVDLEEFFNEELSPRNIGITAQYSRG